MKTNDGQPFSLLCLIIWQERKANMSSLSSFVIIIKISGGHEHAINI